jgi:hypothetical protein
LIDAASFFSNGALSAFGAIPLGSYNTCGFGGFHQSAYHSVALFIREAAPDLIVSIARTARVELRSDGTGLAQLLGAGDLDLLRFGETA